MERGRGLSFHVGFFLGVWTFFACFTLGMYGMPRTRLRLTNSLMHKEKVLEGSLNL